MDEAYDTFTKDLNGMIRKQHRGGMKNMKTDTKEFLTTCLKVLEMELRNGMMWTGTNSEELRKRWNNNVEAIKAIEQKLKIKSTMAHNAPILSKKEWNSLTYKEIYNTMSDKHGRRTKKACSQCCHE